MQIMQNNQIIWKFFLLIFLVIIEQFIGNHFQINIQGKKTISDQKSIFRLTFLLQHKHSMRDNERQFINSEHKYVICDLDLFRFTHIIMQCVILLLDLLVDSLLHHSLANRYESLLQQALEIWKQRMYSSEHWVPSAMRNDMRWINNDMRWINML